MAKKKRKWWFTLGFLIFIFYILTAARPIPGETILKPKWITSLESNFPVDLRNSPAPETSGHNTDNVLLPFRLGNRYGYIGEDGIFSINHILNGNISLSETMWAEYENRPDFIRVMNPQNTPLMEIENAGGYPLFIDNRVFIISSEQNSLSLIGWGGAAEWIYDFPAPITCIDASNGYVLAGTLDGAVILLDSSGNPVFTPFEPGGSRLSVILGCAISKDASLLAIISGIDNQRFLLMEHFGETYRVIHHEFLATGFRRPVHISFADNDNKIAYEHEGGLNIYDINSRSAVKLKIEGEITILDDSGGDRFLYVISSQGQRQKRFTAIRYPGTVVLDAPFKSENAFFARRGNMILLGGDLSMACLELGTK